MHNNRADDDNNQPNLFHRLKVWAESAVAAEDLLINNGGNRQAVKIRLLNWAQNIFIFFLILVVLKYFNNNSNRQDVKNNTLIFYSELCSEYVFVFIIFVVVKYFYTSANRQSERYFLI